MKRVLIISPHFPPSNLAAVHRSRLFAQHLPSFGWEPIILTVHEKHYEEKHDWNLVKLLPENLRIEKVDAYKLTNPRIIGDIGLRAFFQLYRRAKELVKKEKLDFVYIPIPSFYVALIGRMLHRSTGVKYGIDFIDPWVHPFPNSKTSLRHKLSETIAKVLEPIAVKNASVITGVAEGYYKGVFDRNPHLNETCIAGAMPYGGEKADHEKVAEIGLKPYLFQKNSNKIQLVYAGAMLPKAYEPLRMIFEAIRDNRALFNDLEIHFIGTGSRPTDPESYNIKPHAIEFGLWDEVVYEYPARIPYLDALVHLDAANGVFILGSTEPHYTPSKVYQGVLSGKPILALLHKDSTALKVLNNTNAGIGYAFDPNKLELISEDFENLFQSYSKFVSKFDVADVNLAAFDAYSARSVTDMLATLFDKAIVKN
ncbi:MAG: hypothetical protein H6551_05825 [Chitinophagales bacterium]|nr:hypothetical protein [Chitinophagaceae bacterium]MCB9064650.1 hypothetical protein [Chitinophagales bacterium]